MRSLAPRTRRSAAWLLAAGLAGAPTAVFADDPVPPAAAGAGAAAAAEDRARIARLEQQVQELLARPATGPRPDAGGLPEWVRRLRLSGSANVGYYDGASDSLTPKGTFNVQDLRCFLDAELGDTITVADTHIFRNAGFTFEWDVMRLGRLANGGTGTRVGELYAELQGFLDGEWLNVQVGRFQLPVGENYLRFSRGQRDNPFASHTFGGPWYWDEGVRIYGHVPGTVFGYVASVTSGETATNFDLDEDKQVTGKLFADPAPWLHLSVSALRSGRLGSPGSTARAALWLGETFPMRFGDNTVVPSFDHGVVLADDPDLELANVVLFGADAVLRFDGVLRLWAAVGEVTVTADGVSRYDRRLRYAILELVVEGRALAPVLAPFYLGLRGNAFGTFDEDEGYLLEPRLGATVGWNQEYLAAGVVVLGWRMTTGVRLLVEYTHLRVGLVSGVTPAIRNAAKETDSVAFELALAF